MSLLTPDSGLLFWMIVSFGIVFAILSKYGFPVIIKAVEQRKAYIDNSCLLYTSPERSLCRKGTNHRRSSPESCRRNPFAGGRGCSAYPRREGESNP